MRALMPRERQYWVGTPLASQPVGKVDVESLREAKQEEENIGQVILDCSATLGTVQFLERFRVREETNLLQELAGLRDEPDR